MSAGDSISVSVATKLLSIFTRGLRFSMKTEFATYEEFEEEYAKHHTCGIPMIPFSLAYDSHCPQCEPDRRWGWPIECKKAWDEGKTRYIYGAWHRLKDLM